MAPWYRTLRRIIWWIFTRIWAPLMALGLPLIALYGVYHPRAADMAALHLSGGEVPLLIGEASGGFIGVAMEGQECSTPPCAPDPPQRSYLVLPRVFSNAAVTVVEDRTTGVTARDQKGYALLVFGIWVTCIYSTWYFWIRRTAPSSNNRWRGP